MGCPLPLAYENASVAACEVGECPLFFGLFYIAAITLSSLLNGGSIRF